MPAIAAVAAVAASVTTVASNAMKMRNSSQEHEALEQQQSEPGSSEHDSIPPKSTPFFLQSADGV